MRGRLSILHFNDVYNIDANTAVEPIGGAARFCTAIKTFQPLNPLVLFSGDAFSPSMRKIKHIRLFNHVIFDILRSPLNYEFKCIPSQHVHERRADGTRSKRSWNTLCSIWES